MGAGSERLGWLARTVTTGVASWGHPSRVVGFHMCYLCVILKRMWFPKANKQMSSWTTAANRAPNRAPASVSSQAPEAETDPGS